MSDQLWDVPRTEEGLQTVLARLKERRAAGDQVSVGYGLLALSMLVKWVRSDNDEDPLSRSLTLANESLEVFRATSDKFGLLRSLLECTRVGDRKQVLRTLEEADAVAAEFGDELWVAMVLNARARFEAVSGSDKSIALTRQALEIFRRRDYKSGIASCLFSLAILADSQVEKRDSAIEAAATFREMGDFKNSSRAMTLAVRFAEKLDRLTKLDELLRLALSDAQTAGDRSGESFAYGKLAEMFALRGEVEQADTHWRFQQGIEDGDVRSRQERWLENVAVTQLLIATLEKAGNSNGADCFREELTNLMTQRPEA